jgi:hypothetical protein
METDKGGTKVIRHGKKLLVTVGALGALAFGGSTLANATSTPTKSTPQPAVEQTSGPDLDKVQSGDQTTPDVKSHSVRSASKSSSSASEAPGVETAPGSETAGEAPGSETAGEAPGSETAGEAPGSETAPGNDGPGGHADEPGNPNADHQFEGVE